MTTSPPAPCRGVDSFDGWPQVISGHGYLVKRPDGERTLQTRVMPVIGWLIDSNGTGTALVVGLDGVVQPADELG